MNPFEKIQQINLGYQNACILTAAGELDLFTKIVQSGNSVSAPTLASANGWNLRALTALLRGLLSLQLLTQNGDTFSVPAELQPVLDSRSPETLIPMIRHRASCLRNWSQLAWVVESGVPAPKINGVTGPLEEYRSFVLAMNSIASRTVAPFAETLRQTGLLNFHNMLDIGGATGTYLKAFLDRTPEARGAVFDLPIAIREAESALRGTTYENRISLVEGDFYRDELPGGFDFHWLSAIIHQHDIPTTRTLFEKSFRALLPGGTLAVRDVFFDAGHSGPPAAVSFALNMLSATRTGMVYTREEVFELFESVGFQNPHIVHDTQDMMTVLAAEKPV